MRRATACAVVRDGAGRVLLQRRRDNDKWVLPGGAIEERETAAEAIAREIEEETGCCAEVLRLVGVYSVPSKTTVTYPNGDVVHYVSVCFECRHVAGEPRETDESAEVRWFTPDEAASVIWSNHTDRLADALVGRDAAVWR
jgi:8-oxo-dGTP diphosphatase